MRPSAGHNIRYVAPPTKLACRTNSPNLEHLRTLKNGATPSDRVRDVSLSFQHVDHIGESQIVPSICIFREDLFKFLWHVAAFIVVRPRIASMYSSVHILEVDAEHGIRKPSGGCWVREVYMNDEGGDEGEEDAEADAVKADERVRWPYHPIAILVEEVAVLLQYRLVGMLLCPPVLGGAVRGFGGRCEIDAGGTCLGLARSTSTGEGAATHLDAAAWSLWKGHMLCAVESQARNGFLAR